MRIELLVLLVFMPSKDVNMLGPIEEVWTLLIPWSPMVMVVTTVMLLVIITGIVEL